MSIEMFGFIWFILGILGIIGFTKLITGLIEIHHKIYTTEKRMQEFELFLELLNKRRKHD